MTQTLAFCLAQRMTDTPCLEHRRRTRSEAVRVLLQAAFTTGALVAFVSYFFGSALRETPWMSIAGCLILIAVNGGLSHYAFVNYRNDGEFVCRLDDQFIECVCPVKYAGENFKLPIDSIIGVERPSFQTHGSKKWYLFDHDKTRYWLTTNYGNPASKFSRALRELNPAIALTLPGQAPGEHPGRIRALQVVQTVTALAAFLSMVLSAPFAFVLWHSLNTHESDFQLEVFHVTGVEPIPETGGAQLKGSVAGKTERLTPSWQGWTKDMLDDLRMRYPAGT